MTRLAPELRRFAPWAFPFACLITVLVLGGAGVSGSSIGLYATATGEATADDAGVVLGRPRAIRSDEWLVRTPWVLNQVRNGLPDEAPGGMGEHDLGVLYDLPTGMPDLVVRPHLVGWSVLGPVRGLAVEWWVLLGLQAVGVYALVQVLTGRPLLGTSAALLMVLAPVTQWWTVPMTFTVVGYGCLAAAAVLAALREERIRWRVGWSVLAGWAGACFAATLYPPWQVGVAIVLAGVAVGVLWRPLADRATRRDTLVGLAVVGAIAAVVAGGLFGTYLLRHTDALDAVAATVYPGQRAAEGGGTAPVVNVLSGPFDAFASGTESGRVSGTNQSESSSGLLLVIPVGVAVVLLAQRTRLRDEHDLFPLLGLLAALTVVGAWMFFPVPSWAGTPLLLNRVSPSRLVLPLVLGGIVALVLLVDHLLGRGALGVGQRVVAVAVTAVPYLWALGQLRIEEEPVNRTLAVVLLACVLVGCFLALGRWPLAGLGVLVAFSLFTAARINPLQQGIAPLESNDLSRSIERISEERPDAGWLLIGADPFADGILTASGVENVGAVSFYPDPDEWEILDEDGRREQFWNRYAHVRFALSEAARRPTIELDGGDSVAVSISSCDPRLDDLGVEVMIVPVDQEPECGTLIEETRLGGSHYRIYEVEVATP